MFGNCFGQVRCFKTENEVEKKELMIKAVFIDIDNTLLDFDAYVRESMRSGFEQFHLRPYEEWMFPVFMKINNEMWEGIEQGTLTFEKLLQIRWNTVFDALDIDFDGCRFETYFRESLFDSAIPVKGAKELLDYLKEKYVVCAASNGPYEQQVNRLSLGGMLSDFSHLFISEKAGASKPSRDFFDYCLRKLNERRCQDNEKEILPEEIMMIGDSLTSDMAGGRNNGLKTCFFDRKNTGIPRELGIDHIVKDLEEIRGFL